ncbi:MAG: hypothetical protein ABIR60_08550 [Allosphingosinicella sp.]
MGWVCEDDGRHEGFFVAVVPVPNSVEWRELAAARGRHEPDCTPEDGCSDVCKVTPPDGDQAAGVVQAACACGWRSGRLFAPRGTTFGGGLVDVPLGHPPTPMFPRGVDHPFELQAIRLWQAHTRELAELPALLLSDR